MSLVIDDM